MSDSKKIIRFHPKPSVVKSVPMNELLKDRKEKREQVLRRLQELKEKRKD